MIEEVKKIISEEFFIEMEEITEESDLRNDLGIDSLAATQLILDLEKNIVFVFRKKKQLR